MLTIFARVMKKEIIDTVIDAADSPGSNYGLLKLRRADGREFGPVAPGSFVEVAVEGAGVLLRRPISVNNIDSQGRLWLLVRRAGRGTDRLLGMQAGERLNIVGPLGNGFSLDPAPGSRVLLVGGGVGVAPLLYLGQRLKQAGVEPAFLLGARSATDLLELEEFGAVGTVHISTEDGSAGERGLVTANSVMSRDWERVYCCGPAPMMKAVAAICRGREVDCEVSLENMMACGLGACLCCVEKTVKGNVCVCTEGPVFNIKELTW